MRSSTLLAAILGGLGFWLLIAAAIYTGKLWLALVAPLLVVAVLAWLAWPETGKIEPKRKAKDTRSTPRTQR
jgi:membrane protein implicated in regulation of membrane protease activity